METNFLENKKVSVKLVQKYRTGFNKGSDGSTLYTGCKLVFQAPTNQYDRLIPILTEEEQRWFEDRMGLDKGSLAFNNKDKSYWKDFKITIDKKGKLLDLNNYEDFLSYRILQNSGLVANSKEAINVLQHTLYMETEDEEHEADVKLADRYEEASKLFASISKSDKKMSNVLRILGKPVAPDASNKWLKAELVKIIDQKANITGQLSMDDFIRVASDKDMDSRIFLMDALEIGEVFTEGSTYKLRAGDLIGYDFGQALAFFNNPKNQPIRLLIEDRIKNNRK